MNLANLNISGVEATVSDLRPIPKGIVGAEITVKFDSAWDGLTKRGVFRGSNKTVVVENIHDGVVKVPPEVATEYGSQLLFGVYGYADTPEKYVIPLLWTYLGFIKDATDPNGDPTTDPTLPVWTTIDLKIGELENLTTTDKSNLVNALNEVATVGAGGVTKEYVNQECNEALMDAMDYTDDATANLQPKGDYATNDYVNSQYNKLDKLMLTPQHNVMVVSTYTHGLGYKSDKKASEIKKWYDGGGLVLLNFDAPDGTGEQSYRYETYRDGKAIFRRPVVDPVTHEVKRIVISIDEQENVAKTDEGFIAATMDNIQQLEDDKANYIIKVISTDKVRQLDALEVLTYSDQYEGKLIEFLTNGDNPSKCVATGRLMTTTDGNSYLVTYNLDGTTTVWNRDSKEKHNFECKNLINEPIIDIDSLTIDVAGDAPYVASVRSAINKPGESGANGIITVIAHSIDKQIQTYQDVETGVVWMRTVTGLADRHQFSTWSKLNSKINDAETSPNTTWSSQKIVEYINSRLNK